MTTQDVTNDEIHALLSTKSEAEWDEVVEQIKQTRNGELPPNWHTDIVDSGFLTSVSVNWR